MFARSVVKQITGSDALSFPACIILSLRRTVSVTMVTISVSGEYLALGWSAITGLLKALSQKISQFPTEKRSSQHSR